MIAPTNDSTLQLPRILCLHGGGTNARIFRMQCRVLERMLRPHFRLVFAEAPLPARPGPDVTSVYKDYGPFKAWLRVRPEDPAQAAGDIVRAIEDSLGAARRADDRQGATGDWVGLLGFSQGAHLAAGILATQQELRRWNEDDERVYLKFLSKVYIDSLGRFGYPFGHPAAPLESRMMIVPTPEMATTPQIAIVGGGIVGLVLAAGLTRRGVQVQLYEQARNFREIGAGIGFTRNTVGCMEKINPAVVTALRSGGAVNVSMDQQDPKAYLRWIDGYGQQREDDPMYQKPLLKLDAGVKGWETVRRDQFLEDLVKVIPEGVVHLRKRLDTIEDNEDADKVYLNFTDGTRAEADAVIACDGIKSRARQLLLGLDNPASFPQYTHKVAYRALIPMDKVVAAIGEYKTFRQHMHVGPNAHLIHYPVNTNTIGATVVASDPNDWPQDKPTTARASRKDVSEALAGWCTPVRNLVELFPEELDQWALFDLFEYPVPKYNKGRVCLMGDAAHASSPHHGAGASFGIEDALCMSTLMSELIMDLREHHTSKATVLRAAFETYDKIRRTRTQWLVNSSRRVCDLFQQPEWANPAKRVKTESCFEEVKDRSFKIWHFNSAAMVDDTIREYRESMHSSTKTKGNNGVSVANGSNPA
ncbi:monooxygenase [Aspergillus bombycis]|uniref:Monooxygenase n=1 Tax=Aspergillus bombycis TaxID=109264 RepID=A0A1F7ZKG5_9EURO|nr:monooxygenase [Aspergillus bombycis]OGM39934.1 monooxygenase [Aspergillus bombycis]